MSLSAALTSVSLTVMPISDAMYIHSSEFPYNLYVDLCMYGAEKVIFPTRGINKGYCIVLYCIVLYCIVLYCIVLYCIVLYCIVLYCIVLYCIVLYCMVVITGFMKVVNSLMTSL